MKIFYGGKIAVLLLLLQLSGAGALRSEAAEMKLWKFPQEPVPVRLNRGDERGQKQEFTPEGLRLSWDAEKFIYAELLTEKMPEIEAFEKAEFKASVRSSGACPVRIFNLRLIDATGESFQWNRPVEWAKAGDYVVSYQVTPENADLHWGGNNDKKIDFPFIPCSYTPLLSRPSTPPNEFYLPFPSLFSSPPIFHKHTIIQLFFHIV